MSAGTEVKETELGPLPADWAVESIAESCHKPEYGYTASATQEAVGPRFLRITDIREHGVDWQAVPYCRYEEDGSKHQLRPDDILFARIGATTGKTVLVRDCPDAVYASYLIRVRAETVDPAFLYYFCNSDMYWRQINVHKSDKLKGGISGSLLAQIRHCSPPLPEQRAIATVLGKIQGAMEVHEKVVATLKELKAATMAKLFHEGLRGEPLKQTEIGEIPESWAVKRFGDFATLQRGYDLPVQKRGAGDVPVIGSNGIVGHHNEAMAKGPGVVTGRSGTIGLSFYCGTDFWPLNTALFVVDFHGNDPLFVHYCFERFRFQQYAAGVSVPTLNRNLVHEALIAAPTPEEQAHIAKVVRGIDEAIVLAGKRLDKVRAVFSSMLHLLMTGKIRLPGFGRKPNFESPWFKPEDVWEFVERLVRKFDPERVILFGSRAWGTPTRDSDVDLLVVMEFEGRPVDMAVRIGAECDDRFLMDLIVRRPAEVERRIAMGDSFFKRILRDGLVLHERAA